MKSNLISFAASEEQLRDIGIEPWVVGAITLGILFALLLMLLQFGKGREHS
ncbi:MAG: hypothetical protein WB508_00260 [Aeromicrobium sp.]|uniref:hypothetical protein n=1 Tax=Aeromicrobium sp. TaxID=1871063 RepID=UPI003C35857E